MSTEAELLWAMKHLGFCYEYLSDLFVRGDGDAREVVTPEQARRALFEAEHGIDRSVAANDDEPDGGDAA